MKIKSKRFWAVLMSVVMIFTMLPSGKQVSAQTTFTALQEAAELVTGDYILINENNYALGIYDNNWILSKEVTDTSTDGLLDLEASYVWHITVTADGGAILQDANGVVIKTPNPNVEKPQNGVLQDTTGTNVCTVAFSEANKTFSFTSEIYKLAQNKGDSAKRFRFLKKVTVEGGQSASYPCNFTLYKVEGTQATAPKTSLESGSSVDAGTQITLTATGSIKYALVAGTDAAQPDKSEFLDYTESITVTEDCTIFAFATQDGIDDSKVVAFSYALKKEMVSGTYFIYSSSAKGVMKYPLDKGAVAVVAASVNENLVAFGEDTDSGKGAGVYTIVPQEDGTALILSGSKYLTGDASNNLYLSDTPQKTETDGSYWELEDVTCASYAGYTIKNTTVTFNGYPVYIEYYNGFKTYTMKSVSAIFAFELIDATGVANDDGYVGTKPQIVESDLEDGTYFIYSPSAKGVMKYELTGGVAASIAATLSEDGKTLTFGDDTNSGEGAAYYEFKKQENGSFAILCGGQYLSEDEKENLYLAAEPVDTETNGSYWDLAYSNEYGGYTIKNHSVLYKNAATYMEYYSSKGFCMYSLKAMSDIFVFNLIDASGFPDADNDGYLGEKPAASALPEAGKSYVIYNQSAGAVIGQELEVVDGGERSLGVANATLNKESATLKVSNGGLIFNTTVDADGYYTFENNGKYLATNNDEELFMVATTDSDYVEDQTKWKITERLGGFLLMNKTAAWTSSSGNSYPIYVEYFSGGFAGYSYKATSAEIFTFNFYETEDTYGTGYVVDPAVVFTSTDSANLGLDYKLRFTLDDLGVIQTVTAKAVFEDGTEKSYSVTRDKYDCSISLLAADLAGHTSFTVTASVVSKESDTMTATYEGSKTVEIRMSRSSPLYHRQPMQKPALTSSQGLKFSM
jgi:hypothetical protein